MVKYVKRYNIIVSLLVAILVTIVTGILGYTVECVELIVNCMNGMTFMVTLLACAIVIYFKE